jgi:hypothetical protein
VDGRDRRFDEPPLLRADSLEPVDEHVTDDERATA